MSTASAALPPLLAQAERHGWLLYAEKQLLAEGREAEVLRRVLVKAKRRQLLFATFLATVLGTWGLGLAQAEHGLVFSVSQLAYILLLAGLLMLPNQRMIRRLEHQVLPGEPVKLRRREKVLAALAFGLMVLPGAWSTFG